MTVLKRCQSFYRAILAVNVSNAHKDLADAARFAFIAASCSALLLVLWFVLLFVRYRVLKRREHQLGVEAFCLLLTIGAFIGLAFAVDKSSPEKRLPFMEPVDDELRKASRVWSPYDIIHLEEDWTNRRECVKVLGLSPTQLKEVRKKLDALMLAFTEGPANIFAVILCTSTALLFLTSVISTFVLMIGKRRPMSHGNTRVVPATFRSIPESKKAEFFSRFIEDVPQPPDNIVLSANSQCTICVGAMLEDIACLPACKHMFHRKCILQWLMIAEKPKCPRCEEPIRLRAPDSGDQQETGDQAEELS